MGDFTGKGDHLDSESVQRTEVLGIKEGHY